MAYDQTDILSTPEGYATPAQSAAVREYAKALLYGSGQQPVRQWTQGLSNIVSALVGGADLYGAGKRDRASDLYDANKLPRDVGDNSRSSTAMVVGPTAGGAAPPAQAPPITGPVSKYQTEVDDAPKVISTGEGSILPGGEKILGWDPPVPLGPPGAGAALPFDGTPANLPPGVDSAPAAIARALAAGGKGMQPPFPAGGVATKAPIDPTGQFAIPPGLVPHRTPVSRDSFVNTAASHRLTPDVKKDVYEKYYGQRQPIQMPGPGGNYIINPNNRNQQLFVPEIIKSTSEAGTAKREMRSVIVPDGKGGFVQKIIPVDDPEMRRGGTEAPRVPDAREPTPPSLDEAPGLLKYAPDEPPGMLGAPPPELAGPAPRRAAQLTDWQSRTLDELGAKETAKKHRETFNEDDVKALDKKYTSITNAGQDAALSKDTLRLAKDVIEDDNMYQGFGADIATQIKRAIAKFGNNPKSIAANELFDKITSGAILQDMRATLQGLGQVRVAEIDLLSKSMANKYNSKEANRAVLELMTRAHKRTEELSKRATEYRSGWRWDKDGKPYKTADVPTYAGLNDTMQKFIEKMPLLSDEETKNYDSLFEKEGYDADRYKTYRTDLTRAVRGLPPAEDEKAGGQPPPPATTRRLPTPGAKAAPSGPPEGFTEPVK